MAKECFTTNDIAVSCRPKLVAVEHMAYNQAMLGLAPYGPYWREIRKIVTLQFLSNRRIELLSHIRVSEIRTSIKELYNNVWSSKKNDHGYVSVELKQWFAQLSFNMVLRMIAGKRYFGAADVVGEEEAKKCLKSLNEFTRLMGVFTVADAIPCLRWLDIGGYEKAMKETAKELDNILSEWLEEHRKKRMALSGSNKDESNQDFIDVMISVLDDTKIEEFDHDAIHKSTTLALILGGTDTTTVTLTWAMCFLLRNPHILEKAKDELNTQVGEERCISESDISKLVYLQAIIKETLRLCPPTPLSISREFSENCTLGGYYVKKGTRLITNLWKIHTDPSVWPHPMEFKPERFLTTHKDIDVRGQHFELLPFGSGRRMCPGISFSLHMVHLTLASFLHSFEILNPSIEPIDMTGTNGLTNIKATPLEVLVKPCLPPKCYI
ncbi:hypothetical protein RIF29_18863 [Crotalaria pallida]|uniref:Cytochrome P450 n=1 Tax=Crotalaria pallida TaxID=3830 RepID=A0AAN9F0X5_CROPI